MRPQTNSYQTAEIEFKGNESGYFSCIATNTLGYGKAVKYLQVRETYKKLVIKNSSESGKVVVGDHFELECINDHKNSKKNVVWRRDKFPIKTSGLRTIKTTKTDSSSVSTIVWKNITKADEGDYECRCHKTRKRYINRHVTITVLDPLPISIKSNFNESIWKKTSGEPLVLECKASGLPVPKLLWLKDQKAFVISEATSANNVQRISITNFNSTLKFYSLRPEDSGVYKCVASNRIEFTFETIRLEVQGNGK